MIKTPPARAVVSLSILSTFAMITVCAGLIQGIVNGWEPYSSIYAASVGVMGSLPGVWADTLTISLLIGGAHLLIISAGIIGYYKGVSTRG